MWGTPRPAESISEQTPRFAQAGVDRGRRNSEEFRHFAITHLAVIEQHQDFTVVLSKRFDLRHQPADFVGSIESGGCFVATRQNVLRMTVESEARKRDLRLLF